MMTPNEARAIVKDAYIYRRDRARGHVRIAATPVQLTFHHTR
jgi:hypothetical protein